MKNILLLLSTLLIFGSAFSQVPVFDTEIYQKALWMTTRYYGAQRMGSGTNWLVWDINYNTSDAPESIKKKVVNAADINLGKSFQKDKDYDNENYDLTGGWFDGKNYILDGNKFFYSVYTLLLGYSEFSDGYDDLYRADYNGYIVAGKFDYENMKGTPNSIPDILDECKYATDFIQKCVYNSQKFYYQKGNAEFDNKHWCTSVYKSGFSKSEGGESDEARDIFWADKEMTSLSALAGASLAIMSRVYKNDVAYGFKCLQKAKTAYEFATKPPFGNPQKEKYYPDLTILCAELFRATNDNQYLEKCNEYTSKWIDDFQHKTILNYLNTEELALYAYCALGEGNTYYEKAKANLKTLVESYSKEGNIIISDDENSPLKYAASGAFATALYSKLYSEKDINATVLSTIEYILGDNSAEYSFIVGLTDNCPKKPIYANYFRSDLGDAEAAFLSNKNAKYLQLGQLVGGSTSPLNYDDSFQNPQNIGGIDFNAPLVGALAYITQKIAPVDYSKVTLRNIQIKRQPSKTIYQVGESLDVSDGIITANYSDGTTQDVKLLNSMITNFSSQKGGKFPLTISYQGKYVSFPIEVIKKETGINISKKPKTEYVIGEDFDLQEAEIQLVYNDNTFDAIPLSMDMITGFSSLEAGKKTAVISYKDWTTTLLITILSSPISSAELYKTPNKTVYNQWETLDVTGGKLYITYQDGNEDVLDIIPQMISGFNSSLPGKETLTIEYAGYSFEYEIEIIKQETPVKTLQDNKIKIYSYSHTIHLENVLGKVEVFDISGRKVFSGFNENEIFIKKTGIYIVRTKLITKKVMIY